MITKARTHALSQLNRFNGMTHRPYSVLEHTILGVSVMQYLEYGKRFQRAFLLHDYEESVFGDITRPLKSKYMTGEYSKDVYSFNQELARFVGISHGDLYGPLVKIIDDSMLAAEFKFLTLDGGDYFNGNDLYDPRNNHHNRAGELIQFARFSEPHEQVNEFNRLFGGLWQ